MGSAYPNERVFLLDENNNQICADEPKKTGEICVSGTAVTMGYFNNKEKTDSAFVQNPLNGSYNEIKYRTGGAGSRCIPFNEEHLADTCIFCGKPAKHMVYWGKSY